MKKLIFLTLLFFTFLGCKSVKQVNDANNINKTKTILFNNGNVAKKEFFNSKGKLDSLKSYYKIEKLDEVFYYNKKGKYNGLCYKLNEKGDTLVTWKFKNGILKKRTDFKLEGRKFLDKINISRIKNINKIYENYSEISLNKKIYLANSLYSLKNYTLALDYYLELEKESLENRQKIKVYEKLSNIYFKYEDEKSVIHYKVKTIDKDKKRNRLIYNLANTLHQVKSYDLSDYYLKIVFKKWPNHSFSHWTLARKFSDEGNYKQALKHINIAYSKLDDIKKHTTYNASRDVKTVKGFIHHKLGNSELGIKYLKESLKEKTNKTYTYRTLGIVYSDINNRKKACYYLKKAKEENYENLFDRNDLEYYIQKSCYNNLIEKPNTKPIANNFIDFNIDINQTTLELKEYAFSKFKYQILNHKDQIIENKETNNKSIDLSNLKSGLYTIKIIDKDSKSFNLIRL